MIYKNIHINMEKDQYSLVQNNLLQKNINN